MIAVLEYYTRLYEAIPERIRREGEGSFDTVRREAESATDALMRQHRDALDRRKATTQLAGEMIQEHEAGYRAALVRLNEASIVALADQLANRGARIAGNRLVGAAAVAARNQRERMDGAVDMFERAIAESTVRVEAGVDRIERRFARAVRRLCAVAAGLLVMLVGIAAVVGKHPG